MILLLKDVVLLQFLLTIIWAILLACAIVRRESLKWIVSVQTAVSLINGIGWLIAIERHQSYSAFLMINIFAWVASGIGFLAELFLLAYQARHRLQKRLCALAVGASIIHIIAHFWIFISLAATAHC